MRDSIDILHSVSDARRCYIRWNGYALHFHGNLCGKFYSVVPADEASIFSGPTEAAHAACDHGLRAGTYEIVSLPDA